MPSPHSTSLIRPAAGPPNSSGPRPGTAFRPRAANPSPPARPPPAAGRLRHGRHGHAPAAADHDGDAYGDGGVYYDSFEISGWRPARPGEGALDGLGLPARAGPASSSEADFWSSASADDDGVLAEAAALGPARRGASSPFMTPPPAPQQPRPAAAAPPASSPLTPDDALLADAPGTQAARLRDLQAAAAARRDVHWAMYRAHSAKANLLATAVLLCTTAGGTSGLVSLIGGGGGPGGGGGGMSPAVPGWGGQAWSAPAPQQQQVQGLYGSGYGSFTAPSPSAAGAAPQAQQAPPQQQAPTAALLAPVLGYAATLVSGWQSYSKPSTAASRHLTAFKRYQLLARHARDALAYGRAASLGRVIQAVERKIDQYCDESPVIGLGEPVDVGGGNGGAYPPPPSPGRAFWMALMELPE